MHKFVPHPLAAGLKLVLARRVAREQSLGERDRAEWHAGPATQSLAHTAYDLGAAAPQVEDHALAAAEALAKAEDHRAVDQSRLVGLAEDAHREAGHLADAL